MLGFVLGFGSWVLGFCLGFWVLGLGVWEFGSLGVWVYEFRVDGLKFLV